jgi:signal transduction histidine kinase
MTTSSQPGQGTTVSSIPDASEVAILLERLEEGVLLVDGARITAVNGSLARMVGETPQELIGRPLRDLVTDSQGRPVEDPGSAEGARIRSARGSSVPVSIRRISPRVLLVVDRSRERLLEQEVWRLGQPEPGGHPSEEEESFEEHLSMIEHEIRTAMTVVGGYVRMLLDDRVGPLQTMQRDFLEEVRRAAGRVETLLDDLLEVDAAGNRSELTFALKPVSLQEVLRNAANAIRPLADERGVRLALTLHPDADPLHADPVGLEQVATNLLSNALKFTPDGSTVSLETGLEEGDEGERVWIAVRDEGPGVHHDEVELVFRPFFRGRAAAQSATRGVGLGLAICQRIVEAHGGSIEAVPSPGGGLFRVTLRVQP